MSHEKKHIGFNRLEHRIEREYEKKGYAKGTAKLFGQETAAKVFREQQHPHGMIGHTLHHPHAEQHRHSTVLPPYNRKHHCSNCGVLH